MIKEWMLKEENSIWTKPLLYSIYSLFIVLLVQIIDRDIFSLQSFLPSVLLVEKSLAETVLSTLSGALLTMTTITFSTIMVVLTTYSSQFSPRTLKNYLTQPTSTRVLGVFMGGFVYSTVSLLLLDVSEEKSGLVLSASIGVLLALLCLGFFAYFIHNVATFIRVSNLIGELTEDALTSIGKEKEELTSLSGELVHGGGAQTNFVQGDTEAAFIYPTRSGYIQLLNMEACKKFADKNECLVMVLVAIGSYVTTTTPLAKVIGDVENVSSVEAFFTIGQERTTIQDREYGIQKLVEVALKAISPGINDPNTAIDCINHLKEPLTEAVLLSGQYMAFVNDNGEQRVLIKRRTAEDILYSTFYQLAHYGRSDISILRASLETLHYVELHSNMEGQEAARKLKDYCFQKFDQSTLHALDKERLLTE